MRTIRIASRKSPNQYQSRPKAALREADPLSFTSRISLFVVGYAAIIFMITYVLDPSRPGITSRLGWYDSWADQTAY